MQNMQLRRASTDDTANILELTCAAYAKWIPVIGRKPQPMTKDYKHAVEEHIIDLLEEKGKLVALVEVIFKPTHLLIENIAVHPNRQGDGLGTKLLIHVEEIARSKNIEEIRLYTNADFKTNASFYSKRGYREFKFEKIPSGGKAVHMKKIIEAKL